MNPSASALLETLDLRLVPQADAWPRLRELLERHAGSEFGRTHGFESIRSPRDFREAIPPRSYDEHRPWIERSAHAETGVLACGEPVGFEKTSGTSSQAKWIPVTPGLQEEFARGLAAWFNGWKVRCPAVFEGRAYWAISPPGIAREVTPGGLPLGMAGDDAYFPNDVGQALADWLVIPQLIGGAETVFEETALALLDAPDLSVISVWSPTFLLGIDAALRKLRGDFCWRNLWPRLAMVSCWADASAAPWIPQLRGRLGGIPFEAKGLLATEGITSLPGMIDGSPRLATECHWHEFLDELGNFTELRDLRTNRDYEVLLTTAGGLFRYRTGDRVRVTGTGVDGLPRLRFIGRSGMVSDLVGEKLQGDQVIESVATCGTTGFMVAAPDRPGYDLWLEDVALAAAVETVLRRNPYFDQALAIGQLAPLRIRPLPDEWLRKLTLALARRRGCRIGDVKLPGLLIQETPQEVESWLV